MEDDGDLGTLRRAVVDAIMGCCDCVLLDLVYKIIISDGI